MIARSMAMVMAMTICVGAGAQELATPLLTIGPVSGVTIDGRFSEGEWEGAVGAGAFMRLGGDLARSLGGCIVGYDAEALLIGWQLKGKPVAQPRGRDGEVWRDDDIELFVQPPGAATYFHFGVGASGDMLDELAT